MPGPTVGSSLGRYRILERIGVGGMGVVFRARDDRLDRTVALKVLKEPEQVQPEERDRLRREALALSRVAHPNIATVFDFDTVDSVTFLVTELVSGEGLDQKLASTALSEQELSNIALQLADGLAAAHTAGVIHCDLKPVNLRLTPEGRLKILDFGIARLRSPSDADTTRTDAAPELSGTLSYMAPEQLRGGTIDVRTDIWGAGVVLYELATGGRPFEQHSPAALAADIIYKAPRPPRSLRPSLSSGVERVILKCLEKDPADRFQTMAEVADALRSEAATPAGHVRAPARRVGPRRRTRRRIRSVLVLPLSVMSTDPEQEFLAAGMTDALIAMLAKISALKVISRTTAMRYKGTTRALPDIADELNVDAVLEGSIARVGDRMRVAVHLVDAGSDTHVWSETYNRPVIDVLALQSELASAVADQIRVTATPQEKTRLSTARAVHPAAYDATLRGLHHARALTRESVERAMTCFREALGHDPGYAPAYAGQAYCYITGIADWYVPAAEALALAEAAAARAIDLDPTLGEGHTYFALSQMMYRWDWDRAEAAFRRALETNPGSSDAHRWYGAFLSAMGRFDEAARQLDLAVESDPLSAEAHALFGMNLCFSRRFDAAVTKLRYSAELDHSYFWGWMLLGVALQEAGHPQQAASACETARERAEEGGIVPPEVLACAAAAHSRAGQIERATVLLEELHSRRTSGFVSPYFLAVVQLAMGQREGALTSLEQALELRSWWLPWIGVDPRFDAVRDTQRFRELARRMKLPAHLWQPT